MRLRKDIPEVCSEEIEGIRNGLAENMSERGRDHKIRSDRIHRQIDSLSEKDRSRLRKRRLPGIKKAQKALKKISKRSYAYHSALGQLSSMPDRKYDAILAHAAASGVKPGEPFIHVCINRLRVRYIRVISSFDDVKQILSVYKVLGGRAIMKLYVKSRDMWVMYAKFSEGYKHVADVFGLDLTECPDYVQKYNPPQEIAQ